MARGGKPAGVFYFSIDDPLVLTPSRDPAEVELLREKALRLDGLAVVFALVVLGIVMVGLGFASQNTLFVASLHRRDAARSAAMRAFTASSSAGLVGPRLEPPEARPL